MGINDMLVELNYLVSRIKDLVGALERVADYVEKVEMNVSENANIDLFPIEDSLNREYSIDLFVVPLNEKPKFILAQPKVVQITSELALIAEDVNKIKVV